MRPEAEHSIVFIVDRLIFFHPKTTLSNLQRAKFEFLEDTLQKSIKDSLSTTMQRAPKRRFRGPRNPKVLRRHLKAVEICLHPSHPSVEWIEIFLWSYEIYQGTIRAVLILKCFILRVTKATFGHSMFRTALNRQARRETTRKVFYLYLISEYCDYGRSSEFIGKNNRILMVMWN